MRGPEARTYQDNTNTGRRWRGREQRQEQPELHWTESCVKRIINNHWTMTIFLYLKTVEKLSQLRSVILSALDARPEWVTRAACGDGSVDLLKMSLWSPGWHPCQPHLWHYTSAAHPLHSCKDLLELWYNRSVILLFLDVHSSSSECVRTVNVHKGTRLALTRKRSNVLELDYCNNCLDKVAQQLISIFF